MVHRLSCTMACGIFSVQGWNPCLLDWQVNSLPLSHQGSLGVGFFFFFLKMADVQAEVAEGKGEE